MTEMATLCSNSMSAKLDRFSLAKPRNTLVSAVSSFTPARRCLLGVADGLAAQSQLKRLGNAVVDGFVYFYQQKCRQSGREKMELRSVIYGWAIWGSIYICGSPAACSVRRDTFQHVSSHVSPHVSPHVSRTSHARLA